MFNPKGRAAVPLTNFGGLVAEADPAALPEGSSPLNWDCDFLVGSVRTRPGLSPVYAALPTGENITWIKSFKDNSGTIRTLLVTSTGDLYVENVTANPGVITLLQADFAAGQTVSGCAAFGRMYMALSPSGMPWQYDGTYLDRVSQEGPGGNGFFSTTAVSATSAAITAFQITSNVVTFTAANIFTAGQLVTISGLSVGTYLNNQVLVVSSTGLSSTQFECAFTNANVGLTSDSGVATEQNTFPISTITQPPIFGTLNGIFSSIYAWSWSAGPGSNEAGNTVTIYMRYSTSNGKPDETLWAAWKAGIPIYVLMAGLNNEGAQFNGIQLITTVGTFYGGTAPNRSLGGWYFTFSTAANGYAAYGSEATGTYRQTAATVTMDSPVPGIDSGQSVTISGSSPNGWNQIWQVQDAPQNGILEITQTSMDGNGNATYQYSQVSGASPAVGDLVTITNTLNGNGIFNVTDAAVSSVGSGTFTVAGFAGAAIAAQTENGQGELAGSVLIIDPGAQYYGEASAPTPFFGNSTVGGSIVLAPGIAQNIVPGTRQAVVIFQTRQGFLTKPSPPIVFTTQQNANAVSCSNIPIGPPNVIARWIAFTEAGQEGSPGAFFYVIEQPVQTTVNGQTVTYSATVINDNVTTSATFTFTDQILLSATEIDITGFDLFNLEELGSSQWFFAYADRLMAGGEQNKVPNFLNLTFNGGYVPYPSLLPFPLGWTGDPDFGSATSQNAAVLRTASAAGSFGNTLYIKNDSGSTQSAWGLIFQNAYEDAYGVPILIANTAYSVRVCARIPSGNTNGALVVDLTRYSQASGYGNTLGSFTIPFSELNGTFQVFSGLLIGLQGSIPSDLVLRVWAENVANGADVEIDHIEVFPTAAPVLFTNVRLTYDVDETGNAESFDLVTGNLASNENLQPFVGAFEMYDQLYLEKTASRYSSRDVANSEPDGWSVREVSQRAGSFGPAAFDVGEEWQVSACRDGIFIFSGKQPVKISQEIWRLWEYVNFAAAATIWVRNDTDNRRILIGVPMKTPNPWLPTDAAATPTSPSHILVLNYLGLDDVTRLADGPQLHTTMFGNLMSVDMRRKWSPWHIACPYADFILRQDGVSEPLFIGAGDSSGNVYQLLDPSVQASDNGEAVPFLYTTSGMPDLAKVRNYPQLGSGVRVIWVYMEFLPSGAGYLTCKVLPNDLNSKFAYTIPDKGGIPIVLSPQDNYERPLNISGSRVYVQFSHNAVGSWVDISEVILYGQEHPTLPIRGSSSQNAR